MTQRSNSKRDKTVELMALREFDPSEVFINTFSSQPSQSSTDKNRYFSSRPSTESTTSCRDTERRCTPLHPLPAVETLRNVAYNCIRCQLSRRPPLPYPNCSIHGTPWRLPHGLSMRLRGGCQVSTPLRRTSSPYRYSTSTSLIRTDTTLPFTTYQNRPKLCCLAACREHYETR